MTTRPPALGTDAMQRCPGTFAQVAEAFQHGLHLERLRTIGHFHCGKQSHRWIGPREAGAFPADAMFSHAARYVGGNAGIQPATTAFQHIDIVGSTHCMHVKSVTPVGLLSDDYPNLWCPAAGLPRRSHFTQLPPDPVLNQKWIQGSDPPRTGSRTVPSDSRFRRKTGDRGLPFAELYGLHRSPLEILLNDGVVDGEPMVCTGTPAINPVVETLPMREVLLGDDLRVRRALPNRLRRMVGAWTFLDHYGPVRIPEAAPGMRVGPHPHIGLQTVSWLYAGEVLHRDSLGNAQLIRPGQLNLMTAGDGVAHSEESSRSHSSALHGLQFWIALPDTARHMAPAFEHYPRLPVIDHNGMRLTLVVGTMLGQQSPAVVYTALTGVDVELIETGARQLPLDPMFEYALLLTKGALSVSGTPTRLSALYYLGSGGETVTLHNTEPARAFLFGGMPFDEKVLLWWNFAARNTEEMTSARAGWEAHSARFGEVEGYDGARLAAPELNWRLKASQT